MIRKFTCEPSRHQLKLRLRRTQNSLTISLCTDYDVIMVRKKKYNRSTMILISRLCATIYHPPPPSSLLCALCYSPTMYNQPMAPRDLSDVTTSNSAPEDQSFERIRNYSPVQDWSASSGMSNTCESDVYRSDAFNLGSIGGGAYNQECPSSLRRVSIRSIATSVQDCSPRLPSPHPITPSIQTGTHITEDIL